MAALYVNRVSLHARLPHLDQLPLAPAPHCPPFSHALMAALYVIVFRSTPACRISSSNASARSTARPSRMR